MRSWVVGRAQLYWVETLIKLEIKRRRTMGSLIMLCPNCSMNG
jgi:hypothetical protein